MADNVNMRDYNGLSKPMRTTDIGTAHVPHHIINDVSIAPLISAGLVNKKILSTVAASLYEADCHAALDGYFWIFDAVDIPADGNRTPLVVPKFVPAGTWYNYSPKKPLKCITGIVLAFSSTIIAGTNFAFTNLAQAIMSGQIGAANGEAS